jgi:hypothetical protein
MERLANNYLDFKKDVREEDISIYDMSNYLHEYLDKPENRQDFIQIIKIFKEFQERKNEELFLIMSNKERLLKSKNLKFQNIFNQFEPNSKSDFTIQPEKLFKISELEKAFYCFKKESEEKREILVGFFQRIHNFVSNLFPIIHSKILKKKNKCLSESMMSSLTLYFIYESMVKLEEALEEISEFFGQMIKLFENWSIGEDGVSPKVMNFLYSNFSEVTYKRIRSLHTRIFLLGKNGVKQTEKLYKELYEKIESINKNYLSPSGNGKYNETAWNRVKLFDPMIKPNDGWTEYKMLFPVNFYENKINQQIIGAKSKDWYLRPHHLETITEHVKSIKDNMLNPKYFSKVDYENQTQEEEESFEQWKRRKGCEFEMSEEEISYRKNIFKSDKLITNIQRAREILKNRMDYFEEPIPLEPGKISFG